MGDLSYLCDENTKFLFFQRDWISKTSPVQLHQPLYMKMNQVHKGFPVCGDCDVWFPSNSFVSISFMTLHQKWSFPLRISSVNVTKFATNCGFGHIHWRNLNGKLHFLCSVSHVLGAKRSGFKSHDVHRFWNSLDPFIFCIIFWYLK